MCQTARRARRSGPVAHKIDLTVNGEERVAIGVGASSSERDAVSGRLSVAAPIATARTFLKRRRRR